MYLYNAYIYTYILYSEGFPFMEISEDEFILLNYNLDCNSNLSDDDKYKKCDNLNLDTFIYNEYRDNDYEGTLDPVNNLYKNNQHDCQYYSVEKFNETFNQDHGLSIIHFNCRSLPQNFDKVKETLNELKTVFDVIALTETWLNTSNMNDYTIEGYESYHSVRENRVGGGVALYIKMDIIVRY